VGPGDRVAVLALNSAETFALLFACGRLGAVLLPLNWRLSPEELRWQLDDCGACLVLADAALAAVPLGRPALPLDAGPGAPPGAGGRAAWRAITSRHARLSIAISQRLPAYACTPQHPQPPPGA
jgi:acyl-CoA synthetase (AMP-forming)/AMP-acid ligase II